MPAEDCDWWDAGCRVGDAVGDAVGGIAHSGMEALFEAMADGTRDILKTVSTFWMEVDSPVVATGSGQSWTGNEAITSLQSWLSAPSLVIFTITFAIVLLKIAFDARRAGEGFNQIIRSLVVIMAAGLPLLAVTMMLINFGDQFSPWVLAKASGQPTSAGFGSIFEKAMLGETAQESGAGIAGIGALLLIFILAIIAGIVQCIFMVVRGAALIVLLAFAQITAAGSATDEGWSRFKRLAAVILGFALYKPAAAIIYGVGLKLMSVGTAEGDQIMNAIWGLTIICLAALALPTLIKFVAPAAAVGSSAAFSGGAAVGAIATGAAVVALAGTGGGAAAAGAAGSAGSSGTPGREPGAKDVSPDTGAPPDGGGGGGVGRSGSNGQDGGSGPAGASPADTSSSGGGRHAAEGGGSNGQGMAFGAQTVQNAVGQMDQAGADAVEPEGR